MNVITELKARIEKRLTETKNPCKSYKTEASAEKATAKVAQFAANHFSSDMRNLDAVPARYVVFYVESMGRWVGAIDLNELVQRPTMTGGYLGICGEFYTY